MKTRSASLYQVAMALLLVTMVPFGTQPMPGQAQGPLEAVHDSHDPMQLQDGQPLPGALYPHQPVARPAPRSWIPMAPPTGIDLDVTYIDRDPMYKAYCVEYPGGIPILCPGTETEQRWPSPGEVVTFTAHEQGYQE